MKHQLSHPTNIFILGGSGFLASSFVSHIANQPHTLILGSRHPTAISPKMKHIHLTPVYADIYNPESYRKYIHNAEVVINFAGNHPLEAEKNPAVDFNTTCLGTINLVKVIAENKPSVKLILIGSQREYGISATNPVSETDDPLPTSLYGWHKLFATEYALKFSLIHQLNTTILRFSSLYGPSPKFAGTHHHTVINSFINRVKTHQSLPVYGDGLQQRDYLYIEDAVNAIIASITNPKACNQIFNIGSGQPISIISLAQLIIRLAGRGHISFQAWPELYQAIKTSDISFDTTKAQKILNWYPQTSLEQGIAHSLASHP